MTVVMHATWMYVVSLSFFVFKFFLHCYIGIDLLVVHNGFLVLTIMLLWKQCVISVEIGLIVEVFLEILVLFFVCSTV